MIDKAKTCQGCPDRVVGCHSRCAGYMQRQGRWQEARNERISNWTNNYTPMERTKMCERMKRK